MYLIFFIINYLLLQDSFPVSNVNLCYFNYYILLFCSIYSILYCSTFLF